MTAIAEKIEKIVADSPSQETGLNPHVQAVIDSSDISSIIKGLPEGWRTQQIVTESGAKAVFDFSWESGDATKRVILSVRAERIAFMGDFCKPHFSLLEGEDIKDPLKVQEQFLDAVAHPATISHKK